LFIVNCRSSVVTVVVVAVVVVVVVVVVYKVLPYTIFLHILDNRAFLFQEIIQRSEKKSYLAIGAIAHQAAFSLSLSLSLSLSHQPYKSSFSGRK